MNCKLLAVVSLAVVAVEAQSGAYGQCGGIGWTGATTCTSGYTCVKLNDWYSQCQPGTAPPVTTSSTSLPPITSLPPVTPTTTQQPPVVTTTPSGPIGSAAPTGLHGLIGSRHGRYYGNIIDRNTMNDGTTQNILTSDFGVITAENSMKWDTIEPSRGQFNFGNADSIVNWATSRGKLMRGHTLVWHSQLPGWVSNINDRNTLTSVIQNHISQLAGRFKGKSYHWDVVNEIFEDNGTWRNSVFYRVLSEDFVDIAFKAARAADPDAKLYINDYNLDYAGPKIDATVALIGRVKGRGTPIDGVGTQSHLVAGRLNDFEGQLKKLATTGLEVAITELDIRIPKPVDSSKLAQQQKDYETVTRACLNVPQCVGITIWGVSDRNSWVDSTFPNDDAPLLWDDNNNRKGAYTGVLAAINA
ncbi:glycoside hydrolase superfamily [Coprinopsis sp. MPI-PUGE-AT-0042]|nr:glycoside hydrolase superfamily [Coprinopsis sp. MPI-PUGE-AT-0042]